MLEFDKLFGRILSVQNDLIVEEELIFYGDLTAGTNFNETSIFEDFGKCELIFKNEDKFFNLSEKAKTKPLILEIFIYENYQSLNFDEFNLFYFFDSTLFNEENQELKKTKKMFFADYEKVIESTIICQHNRFYNTLQTDSEGNVIEPEDFNKIYYTNEYHENIINDLYNRNLINPVEITKGKTPNGNDNSRKMKGLESVIFENLSPNRRVSYNCEKKSLYEIREAINSIIFEYGQKTLYKTKIKINERNKIEIHFVKMPTITLNALLKKEKYSFFENAFNISNNKNYGIIESDKVDFIYKKKLNNKGFVWRNQEKIEKASLDDEATTQGEKEQPLTDKLNEILRDNREEERNEIEIEREDYFKKINPQTIIYFENFENEKINGTYIIHSVSGIVEQTYINYSIDKIEKLEE